MDHMQSVAFFSISSCFFFFFQAEDGIRDTSVTGVQTCALPILTIAAFELKAAPEGAAFFLRMEPEELFRAWKIGPEIGRASCREREGSTAKRGEGEGKTKKSSRVRESTSTRTEHCRRHQSRAYI